MSFAQSMGNIKKGTTNSNSIVTTIIQTDSSNNLNSTNFINKTDNNDLGVLLSKLKYSVR